jgi:hypothetical protein
MNRRHLIIISILCAALMSSLTAAWIYPKFKKIEKRGPEPEIVAAVLPGEVNTVAGSIGTAFNDWSDFDRPDRIGNFQNKFPSSSRWSHFFLFGKDDAQHSSFPSDEEILLDRGVDSFVERYVQVQPELRARDFYLYEPTGDYYWGSEYFYRGERAKFRCSFLIHLEPTEKTSTRVEIFEYQPTIWVGEYFGLSAHAILPAMLYDIRSVEATTADRKEVIAIIQKANRQDSARLEGAATALSTARRRGPE